MTTERSTPVVLALLKAPRPGLVKTRLAHALGAERAAVIYRRLVERQMRAIPRGWRVEVHFTPADAAEEMQRWLGTQCAYHAQTGNDLGDRLIGATTGAFERGAERVVVIGGDCPGLDEDDFRATDKALASADVVLGPAADGGYYLIALRRPVPDVFRDVRWSSAEVLATTLERVRRAGLTQALLPLKEDVDDLASWRRAEHLFPALVLPPSGALRRGFELNS